MKLNMKEMEVLKVLLSSDQALTATQIVKAGNDLTQSTVQAVLRKLLAKELVEAKGVTHSGNVLCRTFGVTGKCKEVINQRFIESLMDFKDLFGLKVAILGMLDAERDETQRKKSIKELEELLDELKGK